MTDPITINKSDYFANWRIRLLVSAIIRRIPIAIGLYNLPLIALGLWSWLMQEKKRDRTWNNRFIAYWLAAVFIPVLVLFPVDRYFLPAFPAVAILMAHGLHTIVEKPTRVILLAVLLSISSATIYLYVA